MTSVEMPLDHLNGKSKEDIAKLGRYNLRVFAVPLFYLGYLLASY